MPRAAGLWTSFCKGFLEALYPTKCPLCGLLSERSPCGTCFGEFVANDPFATYFDHGLLDFHAAIYRYEGRAAQAVRRLKYSRCTSLAAFMADEIAEAAERLPDYDLVVPVPIHWSRRHRRGFNQAELLAERLSPTPKALIRVRSTRPQAGLPREQREKNIQGAFRAATVVSGKRVLLIDDVLTSGHTARECAKALRAAGAAEVGILAYCGS